MANCNYKLPTITRQPNSQAAAACFSACHCSTHRALAAVPRDGHKAAAQSGKQAAASATCASAAPAVALQRRCSGTNRRPALLPRPLQPGGSAFPSSCSSLVPRGMSTTAEVAAAASAMADAGDTAMAAPNTLVQAAVTGADAVYPTLNKDASLPASADTSSSVPSASAQQAASGSNSSSSGKQEPKSRSKPRSKSRLAKMEDPEDLDELLSGVYDNEEELVAKLMTQLQGLSHKQQRLYGIWDGTPDGGRRAFIERWRSRHAERRAMVAAMAEPGRDPRERMALRTDYILRWRKILFSCPGCWLLPGLCVCGRMRRFSPQRTQLVVHAHHGEWGSASNSGCILPTSLEGAQMLLYGHPEHDARLREILADTSRTTALLYPSADALLPEQLSALASERSGGRVTVVALDATWGNARRMQGWFPEGTLTVRLPPESTLKENKLSLLRPVRRYRGDLESGRVSTVEAVASLLYELEGDEEMYRGLLDNLKIKVDACRLQKNRSLVYDTHAPEERSARHRWRGAEQGGGGPGGAGAQQEGAAQASPESSDGEGGGAQ